VGFLFGNTRKKHAAWRRYFFEGVLLRTGLFCAAGIGCKGEPS
jgi:hypothetical protein